MTFLKKGLNGILKSWGHNVVLQRRAADGVAFSETLEKFTVRHMYPANRGLPKVREERPEGIVHTVDMIYFFEGNAYPKEGDRIYERDAGIGQTTWIIDYSLPMRGLRGNIVFYEVGCTREAPN